MESASESSLKAKSNNVLEALKSLWKTSEKYVKNGTIPTVVVSRFASILLLHPLDTFKTRLQQTTAVSAKATSAFARNAAPFAGLPAALMGQLPYAALSLLIFVHLKESLGKIPEKRRLISAALISDCVAALWLTPFESMKLRVQTSVQPCVNRAFRSGSLYSGLGAQLLRDVPYRSAHVALVAALMLGENKRDGLSVARSAAAASAVAIVTTPLDVIRTRVMAQKGAKVAKVYKGAIDCASRILKREGVRALFKGMVPRAVYMGASVLVFSAAFMTVERFGDKIGKKVEGVPIVSKGNVK